MLEPLIFAPYLRPQIWGGRNLARWGKILPDAGTYGESWEISAHPHHQSQVREGVHQGARLEELARQGRAFYGLDHLPERFPLLIKILDCQELLSIQVHPNDEQARALLGNESGKTEAWVVLEAAPTARIFAGLKAGTKRDELEKHLAAGTTDQCLHSFTPNVGDCLFIAAGTVHAVGGGVVMAEVQQTSDATFRLFDWNRLGSDGKPRTLHLRESLASINWQAGPVQPTPPTWLATLPGDGKQELLVQCPYFRMERLQLSQPWIMAAPHGLAIVMVLEGSVSLEVTDTSYRRSCTRGETVLLPASLSAITWHPAPTGATLLQVTLPLD